MNQVDKKCKMCGKIFVASLLPSYRQIFCGSSKRRIGCSYKNTLALSREWARIHKERHNEIHRMHTMRKGIVRINENLIKSSKILFEYNKMKHHGLT